MLANDPFVVRHKHRHHKFSQTEDRFLMDLVEEHGTGNWELIASKMPDRCSRQCKERWMNYLRPDLNHSPWTDEEDSLLLKLQAEIGNRWTEISRSFSGRTDAMLKNRFNRLKKPQSIAKQKQELPSLSESLPQFLDFPVDQLSDEWVIEEEDMVYVA